MFFFSQGATFRSTGRFCSPHPQTTLETNTHVGPRKIFRSNLKKQYFITISRRIRNDNVPCLFLRLIIMSRHRVQCGYRLTQWRIVTFLKEGGPKKSRIRL